MTGWKTKLGGALIALSALVGAMGGAFHESKDVFTTGASFLFALGTAVAAWGIGHKIDKIKQP